MLGWIVEAMRQGAASVAKRRIRRETQHSLAALDDRLLKDLGFTRSDLGVRMDSESYDWRPIDRQH